MKPATDRRSAAEVRGRRREFLAAFARVCKFYRVMGRRVRIPAGEIGLVALAPAGRLCFIEGKARHNQKDAVQALSDRQRIRIERAAEFYLRAKPALRHKAVRFDIMLITPRRRPGQIRDARRPGF